jgi:lipopolysaccharide biosynthesis protein
MTNVCAIAFYPLQFQPIPENDEWCGKGFTKWTNTVKVKPLFPGRYQPQVPVDLGFHDLNLTEIRVALAEMDYFKTVAKKVNQAGRTILSLCKAFL